MIEVLIGIIGAVFLFFEFAFGIYALIIFRMYEKKNQ
jgi:hypothetical protein